jgi:Tfp pilus assembly protein PilE
LVELMIVVAVMGILAAIAVPSYKSYITKSRAQAATMDLVGMALALENGFQKTLAYPVYASVVIPAAPASRTAANGLYDFSTWAPSQSQYFNYSVTSGTSTFTVTATGNGAGMSAACRMTMTNDNVRTVSADNSCGFTAW